MVATIVNPSVPIMFAHGERLILPALLLIAGLIFIIYPAALWVLANSGELSRRRSVILCGVVLTLLCGGGAITTVKGFSSPPELGDFIGFSIWAIPGTCGLVAFLNATVSAKHERNLGN
jgi:hypothetical protein